jgi:extradiol dioxygenase family protein
LIKYADNKVGGHMIYALMFVGFLVWREWIKAENKIKQEELDFYKNENIELKRLVNRLRLS